MKHGCGFDKGRGELVELFRHVVDLADVTSRTVTVMN